MSFTRFRKTFLLLSVFTAICLQWTLIPRGSLHYTGSNDDFYISGNGYLCARERTTGERYFVKSGTLTVAIDKTLVTETGHRILELDPPILVTNESDQFQVNSLGEVTEIDHDNTVLSIGALTLVSIRHNNNPQTLPPASLRESELDSTPLQMSHTDQAKNISVIFGWRLMNDSLLNSLKSPHFISMALLLAAICVLALETPVASPRKPGGLVPDSSIEI